jgi:hypothetical protein
VGAFRGKARWLLILAVPLLVLVGASAQVQRADITTGQVQWAPTQSSSYSLTAGTLDIDFSAWQGQPKPSDRVTIDMGLGEVRIAAPRNWELRLISDVGPGAVHVDGTTRSGQSVGGRHEIVIPATAAKTDATLTVDVSMQAGSVHVETGAPAAGTTPKTTKEKAA